MTDFDQPDRNADVEDPVLPDEAVIGDRMADIGGDLVRLVDRVSEIPAGSCGMGNFQELTPVEAD